MKQMNESVQKAFDDLTFRIDPGSLLTEEESKAIQEAEKKKAHAELVKQRFNEIGVPKRLLFARERLKVNTPWGEAAAKLKNMIGTGTLLVLRGQPGTGKSQLAAELLIHGVTEKDLTAKFVTFTDIQLQIKTAFNDSMGESAAIKTLTKPDILAIDEFDWIPNRQASATDDYWQSTIYHIINKRYNDMKDTILTSNKTEAEFAATTIAPIKSRIAETGGLVSTDDWTNWRERC